MLLRSTTCDGLTKADLIAFKANFGGTAFACPVKGCGLGFCSETELNNHKAQRHKPRLKCYQGMCIHNDVGFANASRLHQHVKQVHKKETPRIPKALKRRKVTEDDETPIPLISDVLSDLDVERSSTQHNETRDDWSVVFNPAVPRLLDVHLVHTLPHESAAHCVRFSMDGKYVATGCKESTQIYDVISGEKMCVLRDNDPANTEKDMYIRAVCFSPDGKYLATGGEDKLIRVNT